MASAADDDYDERLLRYVERFAQVLEESGVPRMPARVFAYVLAEDSDRYTAGELAAGLRVSPAAISGAVRYLIQAGLIDKEREPGVRSDLYRIYDDDVWSRIFLQRSDLLRRYQKAAAEGEQMLGLERAGGRRMRESRRFFVFLEGELGALMERWREHRSQLGPDD